MATIPRDAPLREVSNYFIPPKSNIFFTFLFETTVTHPCRFLSSLSTGKQLLLSAVTLAIGGAVIYCAHSYFPFKAVSNPVMTEKDQCSQEEFDELSQIMNDWMKANPNCNKKILEDLKSKILECKRTGSKTLDFSIQGRIRPAIILSSYPDCFNKLPHLEELNLSNCRNFELKLIASLHSLKKLDVSKCMLSDIPVEFPPLHLKELNLRGNALINLSQFAKKFPHLEVLDLSAYNLRRIPEDLHELKSLKKLKLDQNRITESLQLPDSIEVLHLSYCKIKSIPEALLKLNSLKELKLAGNGRFITGYLNSIPTSVEVLDLSSCKLEEIPEGLQNFASLRELKLGRNGLIKPCQFTRIPASVEVLDLNKCYLREIPEGLSRFISLKELNLSSNTFETAPQLTRVPTSVEILDLSNCALEKIPEALNVFSLKTLVLSHNKISEFPTIPENLKGLEVLKLSGTHIKSLPENFNTLRQLKVLHLAQNKLTSYPEAIFNLPQLEVLDVSDCNLSEFPYQMLSKLTKLKKLSIDGSSNPINRSEWLQHLPDGCKIVSFYQT